MVPKRLKLWSENPPDSGVVELAGSGASCPATMLPVRPIVIRINQLAIWGMLILSLAGLLSLFFSNFVPSHITVQVAKAAAFLIGLFYGFFYWGVGHFGVDMRNPKGRAYMEQHPKLAKKYIRVPVGAFLFAGFAWMSFSNVFPWVLNAAIGGRGTMVVVVDGWEGASYSTRGSHFCAKPMLRGVPFGMMGMHALCVGDQYRKSDFPLGTSLDLIGRVSALGIAPGHYRVLSRGSGK